MGAGYIFLIIISILVVIALISLLLYFIFKSPFKYPYLITVFDVSGKRAPNVYNLIDSYLIEHGFSNFSEHYKQVSEWKKTCMERIESSKLKNLRLQQFQKVIDDEQMFCFELIRKQTRYKQVNYERTAYTVYVTVGNYGINFETLKQRFDALANINFECTLAEYHSKEQRKIMTKALRDEIAARDNYTCQICGKYMPDGVGLHIDHIIPIAKGGKSIPSNLQVLCSKCNGKKSRN